MDTKIFYQKKSIRKYVDNTYKGHASGASRMGLRKGPSAQPSPGGGNETGSPQDVFRSYATLHVVLPGIY